MKINKAPLIITLTSVFSVSLSQNFVSAAAASVNEADRSQSVLQTLFDRVVYREYENGITLGESNAIKICHVTLGGKKFTIRDVSFNTAQEGKIYKEGTSLSDEIPRGFGDVSCDGKIVGSFVGSTKFWDTVETLNKLKETYKGKEIKLFSELKANGFTAHFSGFTFEGVNYLIIGSKNKHILVRADHISDDIANKAYAQKVGSTYNAFHHALIVADAFTKLKADQQTAIVQRVIQGQETLCAECLLETHIVDPGVDPFQFFAIRSNLPADIKSPSKYPPLESKALFKDMHLPFVGILAETTIDVEKENVYDACIAMIGSIPNKGNYEGAVVYAVVDGKVVNIVKSKFLQYIINKIIRDAIWGETARRGESPKPVKTSQEILAQIKAVFDDEANRHLRDEQTSQWFQTFQFKAFLEFLQIKRGDPKYTDRGAWSNDWLSLVAEFNSVDEKGKEEFTACFERQNAEIQAAKKDMATKAAGAKAAENARRKAEGQLAKSKAVQQKQAAAAAATIESSDDEVISG